jgi:hypothetical protein
MSNPEFKRNLWLSFSAHRLIGMPALLLLTFWAVALADISAGVADRLYSTSISAFIFIVWLWGARNANSSIIDEFRDKTWDQQRMSSLAPWTMTWGKLFGSTAFNWYGGLLCLAVVGASGIAANKPDTAATMLTLSAVVILIHAGLIALNLHSSQFESRFIQRGGMGWLAIIFVFTILPLFTRLNAKTVTWWDMDIPQALFWLDSSILFATCATFAAWRVVSNALQVRTLPWAWPAFACILAVYFSGFASGENNVQTLGWFGLITATTMTYAAMFTEPNTLLRWRKLRLLQSREDWRGLLEHLPLWPTTLALTFLFALLILLTWSDAGSRGFLQPQHALTLTLMLLRDVCVLLFFSLSSSKRAVSAAILYLVVLNMLLPFLAGVARLDSVRFFFLPFEKGLDPWASVLIMSIHASIALGLVNWRLRTSEQQ